MVPQIKNACFSFRAISARLESEEGKWVRSRGEAEEAANRKQRNERDHRPLLGRARVPEVTKAFTFSTEVREQILV